MALNRLYTIVANDTTASYTAGDLIEVYYNDSTEAIDVYLNSVLQGSGGIIYKFQIDKGTYSFNGSLGPQVQGEPDDSGKYLAQYSFCNGANLVDFPYQELYPYAKIRSAFNQYCSTGVCDLAQSGIVSVTKASAIGVLDGAIGVTATTSNGIVKYALFDFDYNSEGQTSGTFSNLASGEYRVYAKDDIGCRVFWDITIGIDDASDYGLKYYWQFDDMEQGVCEVNILQLNYSGSSTEKTTLGATPLMRMMRGDNASILNAIFPTECDLVIQTATDKEWLEIFANAGEKEYLLKYYYTPNGGAKTLIWQGFPISNLYREPYEPVKYYSTVGFGDGLVDLKDESFVDESGNQVYGDVSILDLILVCLNKTGLNQDIRVCMTLYEDSQNSTASDDPLAQTYLNTDMFYQSGGTPDSCYAVLEKILGGINCRLFSDGGYWYVVYKPDLTNSSLTYREFDSDGTYVSNGTINHQIEFKEVTESNRAVWLANGKTLQTEPQYKTINVNSLRALARSIVVPFEERYKNGNTFQNWSKTLNGNKGSINVAQDGVILIDEKVGQTTVKSQTRGFLGLDVFKKDVIETRDIRRIRSIEIDRYLMKFDILDGQGGNAYISTTGNIEYKGVDQFTLKFDVLYQYNYLQVIPYAILKIRLKVGSKYLKGDGTWTSTEVDFSILLTDFNNFAPVEITANFDEDVTTNTSTTYELRIYNIDPYEANLVVDTPIWNVVASAIESYSTTSLNIGDKLIVLNQNSYGLTYWNLVDIDSVDSTDGITPNDNSSYRWLREGSYTTLPSLPVDPFAIVFPKSNFFVGTVEFKTLPEGEEIEDIVVNEINSNLQNKLTLDVDLFCFDLDQTINNTEELVINYFKLSNGDPTDAWGTDGKNIQQIIKDQIATWYNKSAYKITGGFKADVFLPLYSVFKEPNDSNRLYAINRISVDDKNNRANAELIEIGADDTLEARAFSSGFSSGFS